MDRERRRVRLADGAAATVHVAAYDLASVRPRVVRLSPEAPLETWCEQHGIAEAVSGGFSVKPEYEPLGELWTDGSPQAHRPFRGAWARRRGALATGDGHVDIDRRDRLSSPRDLLQAGPVLVRDGRCAIAGVDDPEGFSATADEFDQDLTAHREPRVAIALAGDRALAVAADGRGPDDAGMTLWEFADVLVELGAQAALNLDGGSASAIVSGGRRLNQPRSSEGEPLELSSPSVTAIVFSARAPR
jgi:Phosphodiester glycosidase